MSALFINAVISAVVVVVALTDSKYKSNKLMNHMKREEEKALILHEMLDIEREYIKARCDENIKKCDKVNEFLSSNTILLNKFNLEIDLNKIIVQEAKYGNKEFNKFIKQLQGCSDRIKELVFRRSDVVLRVVKLKRPYYYAVMRLKKSIILQMVLYLVKILEAYSKIFPNQKTIKEKQELWQDSDIILKRSERILGV